MKKYCPHCLRKIEWNYGTSEQNCPFCKQLLKSSDVMPDFIIEARINQLKAMHDLMKEANDEEIYYAWINEFPDEPQEDDFLYVSTHKEAYNDAFDEFIRLISYKGNRY